MEGKQRKVCNTGMQRDYAGHHYPLTLKEAQQDTQQVCLLHVWDFLGRTGKKTTLEGKTTPWSYPQKRHKMGSLMASPLLLPFSIGQISLFGELIAQHSFLLREAASVGCREEPERPPL